MKNPEKALVAIANKTIDAANLNIQSTLDISISQVQKMIRQLEDSGIDAGMVESAIRILDEAEIHFTNLKNTSDA